MQFYEKLDFLMKLTNTTNSALSLYIKIDSSHISRLRRGQRNAPKDESVITKMADYFIRHCESDYQLNALFETLKINMPSPDASKLSALTAKWLKDEKSDEIKAVGGFLDDLNKLKLASKAPAIIAEGQCKSKALHQLPQDELSVYYGIAGKRRAAEYFLQEVVAQKEPQTLLLYSDESIDWMVSDRNFAARWAGLMVEVLSKGNQIKIIHTVSRDLDEMLNALRQWMPLYMTGLIEPYHYPRKRDGVFKQTMFICPNVSAVISSSVGQSIDNAANLLIRNPDAIRAYSGEFYQYLSRCKPLMRIFTGQDKEAYLETLHEFEKEKGNSMIRSESLSLLTMPESVSSKIMTRLGRRNYDLAEYQRQRKKIFENILQTNSFYEIIPTFDFELVNNNKIKVSFSDVMDGSSIFYKKEEYIEHLEHLIHLLNTNKNFHVKMLEGMPEGNYMVYAKEELGVIVAKTSAPPVILAINETNLTAACWDFLKDKIGDRDYQDPGNREQADKLKEYVQAIKNG